MSSSIEREKVNATVDDFDADPTIGDQLDFTPRRMDRLIARLVDIRHSTRACNPALYESFFHIVDAGYAVSPSCSLKMSFASSILPKPQRSTLTLPPTKPTTQHIYSVSSQDPVNSGSFPDIAILLDGTFAARGCIPSPCPGLEVSGMRVHAK